MNYQVWILLASLLGTAWATPREKGPQTLQKRSPDPKPQPKAEPEPDPKPQSQSQQQYQEVILYLTPSEINHLEQTQNEHGMIQPTSQQEVSLQQSQAEPLQPLLEQQQSKAMEQELQRQHSTEMQKYLSQQEFMMEQQSKQLEQQYVNVQESTEFKQQELQDQSKYLEQHFLKQPDSRELDHQLLKEQSKEFEQHYLNDQSSRELEQHLLKEQTQEFGQQYQNQVEASRFEQHLLNERSKELEELFIKEQEAIELENQLLKHYSRKPQEFSPYFYLPQLQNNNRQYNKESSQDQKLQQKYMLSETTKSPYKSLTPQKMFVPQEKLEEQVIPVVEQQPHLQYINFNPLITTQPISSNELRQQLLLQPTPQFIKMIEQQKPSQQPLEFIFDPNTRQKFCLIPYQYNSEQQQLHQELGQRIFEQKFVQEEKANKEWETGLKLNHDNQAFRKFENLHEITHKPLILSGKPIAKLEQTNQENTEILDQNKPSQKPVHEIQDEKTTQLFPRKELPEDTPKLQDLANLDLLQKINQQSKNNENLLTHMDLLNQDKQQPSLQYASNYKEPLFSLEEIERVIKNIQLENEKAKAKIEAISKSPPEVINEEVKITKRPIEVHNRIKLESYPVPYPFLVPKLEAVKIPQPYAVPLEIIKPYAVPVVKTEKVEVDKPVPVEVVKHVPVEVEKKVFVKIDKPYLVDRIVPYEINKEIPVKIPMYKPQKIHLIRHVWEN